MMDQPKASDAQTERRRLSEALISAGRGSQSALEEVYSRTSAKLFGICLRILGDRDEAEEALQEVYVNVWRKAAGFDPERASPITWLATMARNRSIDRLRSLRSSRMASEPLEAAESVADESDDALALLETAQDGVQLMRCVEELEERQSDAIRSAFFGGFSYPELAERANVPLGTMKSWVRRGLIRLKECLER